jgi:hypothetical protein
MWREIKGQYFRDRWEILEIIWKSAENWIWKKKLKNNNLGMTSSRMDIWVDTRYAPNETKP